MKTLAVIPARGGSKGLPGKNIKPLAGLPLIAHAIKLAEHCASIDRAIVTTDCEAIADVARAQGGDVPFIRPSALAQDDTPMLPVLQHALQALSEAGEEYDRLLLLDPTSPGRLPEDVTQAQTLLDDSDGLDGVVSVTLIEHNPIWYGVVERDGQMEDLFPDAKNIHRRQDVPDVFRINGMVYLWTTSFLRGAVDSWRVGRHAMLRIPEARALNIDTPEEFARAEHALTSGALRLPWLTTSDGGAS